MKLTFDNVRSTEHIIPPRCRKTRPVERISTLTVNIREVSAADIKPAFIVREYDRQDREIHEYKGHLYIQMQDRRPDWREDASRRDMKPFWVNQKVSGDTTAFLRWYLSVDSGYNKTLDEIKDYARARASRLICVDGWLFFRCGVPYYTPITFGLGMNHAVPGTSYNITFDNSAKRKLWGYTPLDYAGMKAGVKEIAVNRGDTLSLDHIDTCKDEIIVLDPSVVKKTYDINL